RVKAPATKMAEAARMSVASGARWLIVFHSTSTSDLRLVVEVVERGCGGPAGELERGLHATQKIARANADPDDKNGQRGQGEDFAERQVADLIVSLGMRLFQRAEKEPLHQPQHV